MNTTNSTDLFVYGFPPTGAEKATLMNKVLAAHHIKTTTGLKIINIRQMNFIKGKVWDETRYEFDTGKGANITVEGKLSQIHINKINETKNEEGIYHLKYYLSNKKLSDDKKLSMLSISYGKKLIEKTGKKLSDDKHSSKKSHPLSTKSITELLCSTSDKIILNSDTNLNNASIAIEQHYRNYKDDRYIPPSERHQYTQASQKSHIKKFKCNILKDLNDKIQENITYNKNLNNMTMASTPTATAILPNAGKNSLGIDDTSLAQNRTYKKINSSLKSNKNTLKPSLNSTTDCDAIPSKTSIKSQSQQTHPKDNIADGRKTHSLSHSNIIPATEHSNLTHTEAHSNNYIDNTNEIINGNANKMGGIYTQTSNTYKKINCSLESNKITLKPVNGTEICDTIPSTASIKSQSQQTHLNNQNKIDGEKLVTKLNEKIDINDNKSSNETRGALLSHQFGEKLIEITDAKTVTASSQNHTSHKNIDNKSIKSITPIAHPLLPINYNQSINMNTALSETLTANKYILNGKNPNVINGALVLLIIYQILSCGTICK